MTIRRHAAYNTVGSIIPIALMLLTVPAYLSLIGEERYGVLAIAWLLLGYFGLFDLGLGRATAQRIAALRSEGPNERARVFWTALGLNAGVGIAGGLLAWPVAGLFFGQFLQIDEALRIEIEAGLPWLIVAVPVATLSGVFTGALQGRERFLELNIISVCGTALFQIFPLSVAWLYSPGLDLLLPAALIARILTLVALYQRCRRHVFESHPPCFDRGQAGLLLRFGGWVSVTSVVGPLMVLLDRLVIGVLMGAKAVTYYTVPFQLASRTTLLSMALSSALFPRLAAASLTEQARLAGEALYVLMVVMTPLVVAGVLMMDLFLNWWLNAEFAAHGAVIGKILLLAFWINGLAYIPFAQLQASGRPDLVAKCHLVEVLPYVGILFLGLAHFGLAGAAAAFGLRVLVDFFLLSSLAGSLRQSLAIMAFPAFLLTLSFVTAEWLSPDQAIWYIAASACLLTTLIWGWRKAPDSLKIITKRIIRQRNALQGG